MSARDDILTQARAPHPGRFNMCGYAAPRIDRVRIGMVGLGNRGMALLGQLLQIEEVEIRALSCVQPAHIERALALVARRGGPPPKTYCSGAEDWKRLCDQADIDVVYVCTGWDLHAPIACYAMRAGKHAAVEVPAARTIDECWELVETSESTRRHCRMLENCCYDFFELLTLNLARQGFFGEIVHCEGAYIHHIIDENFNPSFHHEQWRLKENLRHGNLYPTHGLGPVCQVMNINRGDRMDYLVSVSGRDFAMAARAQTLAGNPIFQSFAGQPFRGNMNTTTIRTRLGRTLMLQHDTTTPRPYSRIHLVSGTKAFALKYPEPERIAVGDRWLSAAELEDLRQKYSPEIVSRIGRAAEEIGGHGGMDFLMNWRIVDCLRHGLPMDDDVYDAALWSSIAPLTEWSVANRSAPIEIPDFTNGAWERNPPVDPSLRGGGTTRIAKLP